MREYLEMMALLMNAGILIAYGISLWFGLIIFVNTPDPIFEKIMLPIAGLITAYLGIVKSARMMRANEKSRKKPADRG